MERIGFHRLPALVAFATGLVLFDTWVLFAEFVVDRYGLSQYLPGYQKGDLCVWEPAVATAITLGLIWLRRRDRRRELAAGAQR